MKEKVIEVIPRVVIDVPTGDYSVIVTNRRTIFVSAKSYDAFWDVLFGGVLLGVLGEVWSRRKYLEDHNVDLKTIDMLACSLEVWHSSLNSIRIRKTIDGYMLELDYTDEKDRTQNVSAKLAPPSAYVSERKAKGMNRRQALREYAEEVRLAYKEALPNDIRKKARWDTEPDTNFF